MVEAPSPQSNPEMLFIGCVDARLPMDELGIKKGSALIMRSIAALVFGQAQKRKEEIEALRYAVEVKGVKSIMVAGHTDCGGIRALLENTQGLPDVQEYLKPFAEVLNNAKNRLHQEDHESDDDFAKRQARVMEVAAVHASMANLMTYDFIRDAVNAGKLELHGALIDVETKKLRSLDQPADEMHKRRDAVGDIHRQQHQNCNVGTGKMPPHRPKMLLFGDMDAAARLEDLGIVHGEALVSRGRSLPIPKPEENDQARKAILEFAVKAKNVGEIRVVGRSPEDIDQSLDNIRLYPCVQEALGQGKMKLFGMLVDDDGRVLNDGSQRKGRYDLKKIESFKRPSSIARD